MAAVALSSLRLTSKRWRDAYASPEVWREAYRARWSRHKGRLVPPHCLCTASAAVPWRELYIDRHLGEISPHDLYRAVKRPQLTESSGHESYRPQKKTERIPGSPSAAVTSYFVFQRCQREQAVEAS